MAETKSASTQSSSARAQTETAMEDLAAQVAALREDLTRLSQSAAAVGQGAKSVVTEEAQEMTEQLRERVREDPIFMVAAAAGIGYQSPIGLGVGLRYTAGLTTVDNTRDATWGDVNLRNSSFSLDLFWTLFNNRRLAEDW